MGEWRRYAAMQKAKRKGKKAGEESAVSEEIVVQRMSSDVSGKQQKYTRIGPQKLSIANIKDACMKYFRPQIEKDFICDVLAGERGPSCEMMAHIPNRKVFYVRFIKPKGEVLSDEEGSPRCKKPKKARPSKRTNTQSLPATKAQSPSKAFPKSLSALEMMKLGKVINEKSTVGIELFKFDLTDMVWSNLPLTIEFNIAKEPFGKGGFREAIKATSKMPEFHGHQWVVKRNFAQKLEQELKQAGNLEVYGPTLSYKRIYMGRIHGESDDDWVTVEEYIDGEFTKYLNNTRKSCGID
ncbi:unnamed protein product [Porites evermanni]|uniref:Uncharacterized protein n=1 Tax=Porites evermanni TaxID=104178 RepID=A0ABN8PE64_9CNID|nr:unnamed protein product [Porites evermanni]